MTLHHSLPISARDRFSVDRLPPDLIQAEQTATREILCEALERVPSGERLGTLPDLPPLSDALAQIDRVFGIDQILQDGPTNSVQRYYHSAETGYRWVHSTEGCMHLALSRDPQFEPADYLAQTDCIAQVIRKSGATRVLELGAGHGFNLIALARALPEVAFIGLDLIPSHIANARRSARGLENVSFVQGSYASPPADLGDCDLVFSIEALCHGADFTPIAQAIARVLRPGGLFMVFDAFRVASLDSMPRDMQTAMRLYEAITAVDGGFFCVHEMNDALADAGLAPLHSRDVTRGVIPSVRRLHRYGKRYFDQPAIRLMTRVLPLGLRRNACAALLGPYLVEGNGPQRRQDGLSYLGAGFRKTHSF